MHLRQPPGVRGCLGSAGHGVVGARLVAAIDARCCAWTVVVVDVAAGPFRVSRAGVPVEAAVDPVRVVVQFTFPHAPCGEEGGRARVSVNAYSPREENTVLASKGTILLGEELALVCVLNIPVFSRARDVRRVGEEDCIWSPCRSRNGHGPDRLRDTRLVAAVFTRRCARPIVEVNPLPRPRSRRSCGIVPLEAAVYPARAGGRG